jgi:hypothetical protein
MAMKATIEMENTATAINIRTFSCEGMLADGMRECRACERLRRILVAEGMLNVGKDLT